MMKTVNYKTQGTCSREINVTVNDENKIESIEIIGGCNGNLKGISSILIGMDKDEVIKRFSGITCGYKPTSCPDQIAKALSQI
ncbi:MAG: TIGR03905 family TSCPD domain-containing protein [Clostridia bacterium]|nr:TIGR03905 family TSCPD domain-containing protein [Clostridia bacterium]